MNLLTIIISVMILDLFSLITPGQDFMIVSRNTLKYSRKIGLMTSLGIGAGGLIHALVAMLGVSVFLASNVTVLAFIRTVGALYLIYLGSRFFRQAGSSSLPSNEKLPQFECRVTRWQAFRMGFIANLLNVEAMLFSMSIFTVVLPVGMSVMDKFMITGVIALDALVWFAMVSLLLGHQRVKNWYLRKSQWLERVAGVVLVFFGSKTLISSK